MRTSRGETVCRVKSNYLNVRNEPFHTPLGLFVTSVYCLGSAVYSNTHLLPKI